MLQGQTWEPRDQWTLSGSLLTCGQLPAQTWQQAPIFWASVSPTCKMGLLVYVRDIVWEQGVCGDLAGASLYLDQVLLCSGSWKGWAEAPASGSARAGPLPTPRGCFC